MIAQQAKVRWGRPLDRERTLCTLSGCIALLLAAGSFPLGPAWPLGFALLSTLSLTAGPALVARRERRSSRVARVSVDERGIALDAELAVATADIEGVHVEGTRLELRARDGRELTITGDDAGSAEALCRELLLHTRARAERLSLSAQWLLRPGGAWKVLLGVAFAFAWMLGSGGALRSLLPPVLVIPLVLLPMWVFLSALVLDRTHVSVGDDGVLLESRLSRRRFIAIDRIVDAQKKSPTLVELRLRDGEVVGIHGTGRGSDQHQLGQIAAALQAARQRAGAREHAPAPALLEASGARAAWLTRAGALLDGGAGYRAEALSTDDVRRALADAGQPKRVRVAAAALLRAREGEEARGHIREALEATAEPDLREELEAVAAAEDDEALVRVLEKTE